MADVIFDLAPARWEQTKQRYCAECLALTGYVIGDDNKYYCSVCGSCVGQKWEPEKDRFIYVSDPTRHTQIAESRRKRGY